MNAEVSIPIWECNYRTAFEIYRLYVCNRSYRLALSKYIIIKYLAEKQTSNETNK